MRSFVTILLAGAAAFLAFVLLSPGAFAQSGQYALKVTLQENGQTFSAPQIVVEPGKVYAVELKAGANYDFKVAIPADTRTAVKAQFDRDLGAYAKDFLLVNSTLSFDERPEARTLPDYGKAIESNLLLRVEGRPIVSNVDVADRGLVMKNGTKIETLSIAIEAMPFQ